MMQRVLLNLLLAILTLTQVIVDTRSSLLIALKLILVTAAKKLGRSRTVSLRSGDIQLEVHCINSFKPDERSGICSIDGTPPDVTNASSYQTC